MHPPIVKQNQVHFISYPRSGRHWVCLMMEQYCGFGVWSDILNQKLRPAIMQGKMLHDLFCNLDRGIIDNGGKLLYAYRSPFDALYSLGNYSGEQTFDNEKQFYNRVNAWINHIRKYHLFFLENRRELYFPLKFEDLQQDPAGMLYQIARFTYPQAQHSLKRAEIVAQHTTKRFIEEVCTPLEPNGEPIVRYTQREKINWLQYWGEAIEEEISKHFDVWSFCKAEGYLD